MTTEFRAEDYLSDDFREQDDCADDFDYDDLDDWQPADADDVDEVDIDVCQNCGGYFGWTPSLRAAWQKHWNPGPDDHQPQRCFRCIVDETWVEVVS